MDVAAPPLEMVALDLIGEADAAKFFEIGGGSGVGGASQHGVG